MMDYKEIKQKATERIELCEKVKEMIVYQLNLDIDPKFITDDQLLFGRGLELDSIDSLQLVVGIYDEFEVSVTEENVSAVSTVNSIVDYITQQDNYISRQSARQSAILGEHAQ